MFGPKANVRAALEMAGIPHTYVVAYGFASFWANGLGEVGPRDRVPPSPVNSSRQVPFYGNGRTKREALLLAPTPFHLSSVFALL